MKKFAFALLIALSAATGANDLGSVYRADSALPQELKEDILSVLLESYPCIDDYGLFEAETTVFEDWIDQGVVDRYYTTKMNVRFTYDYHPNTAKIVVESVLFSGSNPSVDWGRVTDIEGQIYCD